MISPPSKERLAFDALREGRFEEAIEFWKDHQGAVGHCDMHLCDNTPHLLTCCAHHFQGRLLTLSMIERNKDFYGLARNLGLWIGKNDDSLTEPSKDGLPFFKLPDSLLIGHPTIDQDHRALVQAINDISHSISGEDHEETARLIEFFTARLEQHFKNEIEILELVNFHDLDAHIAIHEALSQKARDIRKQANSNTNNEIFRQRVFPELVSFLLEDAIKADLEFKTFLQKHGHAID